MKKFKKLYAGILALAATLLLFFPGVVQGAEKQYWTESIQKTGSYSLRTNNDVEQRVLNNGYLVAGGEEAFCVDLTRLFTEGYKVKRNANLYFSEAQIEEIALSIEYVELYGNSHGGLNENNIYLMKQCVLWRILSDDLGWNYGKTRPTYDEIPQNVQEEIFEGAEKFAQDNKGRYECSGEVFIGNGQPLGRFRAVQKTGTVTLKKISADPEITNGNNNYSLEGAVYGIFSDQDCTQQIANVTTDADGNTAEIQVAIGDVYIKELVAPRGYTLDYSVHLLHVEENQVCNLEVADKPQTARPMVAVYKIDVDSQDSKPQGNGTLEGAEFVWKYYDGYYDRDNLPAEPVCTWTTKTIIETDAHGTRQYVTRLDSPYQAGGDSFYTQDGACVIPLGTLALEEIKAPAGYLPDHAWIQVGSEPEELKNHTVQIVEQWGKAVFSGYTQMHVTNQVIRGGVEIQKRDLETGDICPQGNATLKNAAFDIISLNDQEVYVEGKFYKKNEIVKTIYTDQEGKASTEADVLPYGTYRIKEKAAPEGYLLEGSNTVDFTIQDNGKIVSLTEKTNSIYDQIKRGDIKGVKVGGKAHKALANVPFKITSKTTGENHIIVTNKKGEFSTAATWASHKNNTNAGKTSEDGIWFGTSQPDDGKGALPYDTYLIEELRSESNKKYDLLPPFEVVVEEKDQIVDLGTLVNVERKEVKIHTSAAGKGGEKEIPAGKDLTIVDTVTLKGLEVGRSYQLKGWQMLKDKNAELLIDGKPVEGSKSFVADAEEMKVKIPFTFDGSELGGKQIVTFEELYDMTNPEKPKKITEHKDIDDKEQTVIIKKKPNIPHEPEKPDIPEKPEEPDKPQEPDKPEEPDKPQEPDKPVQPKTPVEPTTPVRPITPVRPTVPRIPCIPSRPVSVKTSDHSGVESVLAVLCITGIGIMGIVFREGYKTRKPKNRYKTK